METSPPEHPAGPFGAVKPYDESQKGKLILDLLNVPERLREATTGLSSVQLDTKYRNWTARQIVHHIADSHLHSYIRFKWTLTEEDPVIKAYDEAEWVQLPDSMCGAIEPSLALLHALHAKWHQVLESMTQQQFAFTFNHPQTRETISLWEALHYYPWHGRHHTAQIDWLRKKHDWA